MRDVPDDPPLSIRLHSDDLPDDPPRPAWARAERVEAVLDSRAFADDNPEALRARGPVAVGSALLLLARWGRYAPWRAVREAARLLEDYLVSGVHHDAMDLDLGLRRRDGSPGLDLLARRAERDRLVLHLARREPWAGMGPWQAAKAIRAAFADYENNRLAGDRKRGTRPTGDDETFWLISRLALPQGGLPKERDLAPMIADRR